MFLIIVGNLLVHLQALIKLHSEGAENKTFVFLAAWTIGLWTVFPIVFVLEKESVMNHDQGTIVQVTLDILAKVGGWEVVGACRPPAGAGAPGPGDAPSHSCEHCPPLRPLAPLPAGGVRRGADGLP